jgi:hypothetical protein
MRFTVLALDYDATIARDGVLEPDVRRAIEEVRKRGITVAIVTTMPFLMADQAPRCLPAVWLGTSLAQEQIIGGNLGYNGTHGGSFRLVQKRDCWGSPAGLRGDA